MQKKLTLVSIVGARPQFIKLAPLQAAVARYNETRGEQIRHLTIHTGQHYDKDMSDIFFEELEIPHPDYNLGVGSGSHGAQTGKMLKGIEEILLREQPDMLIIFGDTNSTAAGALAAAKIHIPIAHVEAGLRSFNRRMPEEINRIVSDHISDILLAPTPTAVHNLQREGLADKTVMTGDIMYDTVLHYREVAARKSDILNRLGLTDRGYAVATVHRAENTDDPTKLEALLNTFNRIAAEHLPIVFPLHPRTRHRLPRVLPDWRAHERLHLIDPVGYLDMIQLVGHARMAFTDSGGLQKEAFFLNCPCITLRPETEWVETVVAGGNIIVGSDPFKMVEALRHWEDRYAAGEVDFSAAVKPYFGEGCAADVILEAVLRFFAHSRTAVQA
ncbi:MAG: UDP-N-acetylglucosamine 2-epimerase (non-hydrolyzing) [Bacteroidia bacterium]